MLAGNTTFFVKAAEQKITWKDVFSDVRKKHSKEDGERLFMAGTALSTPHESRMISEWKKPWVFARVGIYGLIFLGVMLALAFFGGMGLSLIPLAFVGALLPLLVALLLLWELNIPRNMPIYEVIAMLFIGGGLSLLFTILMSVFLGSVPSFLAPLYEEPAKLIALCIFLKKLKYKYILNGVLIGGAVGAGFDAMETMSYFVNHGYGNLLMRSLQAPGGHLVWAAIYGGALAMVKGGENLQLKHFLDSRFLSYFGVACLIHAIWNFPISLFYLPLLGDVKHYLLTVGAWLVLLRLIKLGVLQCMRIPQAASVKASKPMSIRGMSGMYSGSVFPVSGNRLVFGRDSKQANIVFPPSAPGISSIHCEITVQNGTVMLTDKNSTYGTFLTDGTRLTPEKPHPLPPRQGFYLGNRENLFEIE